MSCRNKDCRSPVSRNGYCDNHLSRDDELCTVPSCQKEWVMYIREDSAYLCKDHHKQNRCPCGVTLCVGTDLCKQKNP